MRKILIPVLIFFLAASPAFAREGEVEIHTGPSMGGQQMHGGPGPGRMASSSPMGMMGKMEGHEGMVRVGSSTAAMPMMRLIVGIVSSIDTNSFAVVLPGNKEHATTTVTVNVTSATKYMHASSTAAFSDLAVGGRVMILGKISTSTKSIAAQNVIIPGDAVKKSEGNGKGVGGFFGRVKNFFFGRHGGSDSSGGRTHTEDTPAAVASSGILHSVLSSMFGWL